MGSGIAEAAAGSGFEVVLRIPQPEHRRRHARRDREVARPSRSRRGRGPKRSATRRSRPGHRHLRPRRAEGRRPGHRVGRRGPRGEEGALQRARPHHPRRRHPGHQHLDPAGHRDGHGRPAGPSRSAASTSSTRRRSWRWSRWCGPITASDETIAAASGLRRGLRQDARRGEGPGRVHRQRAAVPLPQQRGAALEQGVASIEDIDTAMKGGCGFPMGPFALLDLVGPRHLARHPRRALRGVPRPQLRRGAAAAPDGRRRAAGPQVGPGLPRLSAGRPRGTAGRRAAATTRGQATATTGGEMMATRPRRDAPWVMRTYSGHSTAKASNELYRTNLAKGQTGLSIAFDLPTQIGYDPDAPEAAGEVGKVGRARGPPRPHGSAARRDPGRVDEHVDDHQRHRGLAARPLHRQRARTRASTRALLSGTTQNDIVKEYLSRGTYIFPPGPEPPADRRHHRLHGAPRPEVEPDQRLQLPPAGGGATPIQEIAYALATAIGVLDAVRDSGTDRPDDELRRRGRAHLASSSTPACASSRRPARCGPSPSCGTGSAASATASTDPKLRRFRYGVQVNSLGLTEAAAGEQRAAHRPRGARGHPVQASARARAIQLPAWNEALGLPRPWDQQWSLRIQQILAFESDLLEYGDIFDGSVVIEAKTAELAEAVVGRAGRRARARRRLRGDRRAEAPAGARARPSGSGASRPASCRWSGVNCFTETAPLAARAGERRGRDRS